MPRHEIVHDGIGVAYRVHGSGPCVALLPAWQLIDSRMWSTR